MSLPTRAYSSQGLSMPGPFPLCSGLLYLSLTQSLKKNNTAVPEVGDQRCVFLLGYSLGVVCIQACSFVHTCADLAK